MNPTSGPARVVALGGNTITRAGDDGSVATQYLRAAQAMRAVAPLIGVSGRIVLTHGNGPVVGDIMLRNEAARELVAPTPLSIADANSEGGIGLMLQQTLGNELRRAGVARTVATVVTQVVVDESDPAFARPTKPIGPHFAREDAETLAAERGWTIAEEPGRGWRRVVASPRPLAIVEADAVVALLEAGVIPIAAGGGGVPVVRSADGSLASIDAVVDKDWASALLAAQIGAHDLIVLMEADAVYEGWGTLGARRIESLTPATATRLVESGELDEGSVAPKVAASAWFVDRTGGQALLCRPEDLGAALGGHAGTAIRIL